MKSVLLSIFIIFVSSLYSQINIKITVKDAQTKEALAFCNISVKNTYKGGITNNDGEIQLLIDDTSNTIVTVSYLGYITENISISRLLENPVVLMKKNVFSISEVNVLADDNYLFEILSKCRKHQLKNRYTHSSKVYYGIETSSKTQAVELLECYYNAELKGTQIPNLYFKNGRVALAPIDSNYFLSLNSSKAILRLDLLKRSDKYPVNPLQLNLRKLKEYYDLKILSIDKETYHLYFSPKQNKKEYFSGDLWIEKENYNLVRINLEADNTKKYPFIPLFEIDTISNVSLKISQTYKDFENHKVLDYIYFDYQLDYKSYRDTPMVSFPRMVTRPIVSKGIIYLYDYEKPFILPYFEYDNSLNDYQKLSIIPYNESFWEENNSFLLTKKQKENLGFIAHRGRLINFESNSLQNGFEIARDITGKKRNFFENYYDFWNSKKRISISKDINDNTKVYSQDIINKSIQRDLYNLEVQILLDVTKTKNGFNCKSYTVFDPFKTFYHLSRTSITRMFLNIYFDICEIERLKMQEQLEKRNFTKKEIDNIYNQTLLNIKSKTQLYMKEVKLGENYISLKKWNKYVFENLEIDNIQLVINSNKDQ